MEINDNELASAHNAINQLFEHMGIKRVICVDDEYARLINVEDVIGYCINIDTKALYGMPLLSDLAEIKVQDEDVFRKRLHDKWEEIEDEQKKDIYRETRLLSNSDEVEPDILAASSLRKILSRHNFKELSLKAWMAEKEKILKEALENKTLILFDQDMTSEDGTATEGIKQIAAIIPKEGLPGVCCGLLTHTGSIDDEPEKYEQFSNDYDIPKENFLFIAKNRLDKPLGFARMLKLMTIAKDCHSLNCTTTNIFKEAIDKAKERIDAIGIYDFEHIIFSHSSEEGIWEPDMLFRLYNLFHKKITIQAARENVELNALVKHIRNVSQLPPPSKAEETPKHTSWKIQKEELYEDGDYINCLHLPIELGDIFEFTAGEGNTKKYVLLGQPCDLMVRPRKHNSQGGRHHNVIEAVIAEIEEFAKNNPSNENNDAILLPKPDPYSTQLLSYYSDSYNKESYVMFRKTQNIRLTIFDLCVFQPDGKAKIEIGKNCPDGVIPTWQEHYKRLQKDFKKAITRFECINDSARNKVKRDDITYVLNAIIPQSSLTNIFEGKINGKTIEYPIRRVGRITQTRAVAILSRYAGYLARTAFDRDFGEEIRN